MLNLECPQCGAVGELDEALANRPIRCPECQAVFDAPSATGSAAALEASGPEFRASTAFARALSVFFRTFFVLVPLAFVVHAPSIALHAAVAAGMIDPVMPFVTSVLSWFLTGILSAVAIYIVFQHLRGARAQVGRALEHGFRRTPVVLGVTFLVGVLLFGVALPGLVLMVGGIGLDGNSFESGSYPEAQSPGLVAFGLLLLFLGMFVVVPRTLCALPVAAVERRGVFGSIARSWELSKGRFWRLVGLMLLAGLVVLGALLPIGIVLAVFVDPVKIDFWSQLIGVPFQAWYTVFLAVLYHDLRVEREGLSAETLASVFE